LAATNLLAKGATREEVELTKMTGEEAARLFLCFIVEPGILFGGGQLFSLLVSNLDLYAACDRATQANAILRRFFTVALQYLLGADMAIGLLMFVPSGALLARLRSRASAAIDKDLLDLMQASSSTQMLLEVMLNSVGGATISLHHPKG
jgi:hypothetical protein